MKAITIVGRLTKDSEVRQNDRGGFVSFSVAVDDGWGENKGVMFFDVSYNRTQVAQYLTKGTQVAVTGDLKTREYNGKTFLGVRPSEVKLLGGRSAEPVRHTEHQAPQSNNIHDDEIPF
jgi:single-strand DNA-binding protein